MLNSINVVCRLTRDPELRYTNSGTAVCNFGIAVDKDFKRDGEPKADFFNVVAWGKTAETVATHLEKGRLVAVHGRLQSRSYESNGQKRTAIEIVADRVHFLDYKDSNDRQERQYRQDERHGQQGNYQKPDFSQPDADDDLPF